MMSAYMGLVHKADLLVRDIHHEHHYVGSFGCYQKWLSVLYEEDLKIFMITACSVGFKEFILRSKKCYSILVLGSNSQILNSIYFYQKIAIRPSSTPFCRHVVMTFKFMWFYVHL